MEHDIKMNFVGNVPRNLFVIGNGFDIWQGMQTSYKYFAKFYNNNKLRIAKELGLEPLQISERKGKYYEITHFDLFYGIISGGGSKLDEKDIFWSDFESALAYLDIDNINLYYGKEDSDLEDMRIGIDQAYKLIRRCFIEWNKTFEVPAGKAQYLLNNSYFINFNYTDTLQRRFGVSPKKIYYPHGRITDEESIVFGHDSRERPVDTQYASYLGNRYIGEMQLNNLLYMTDKKVRLHIADMMLTMFEYGFRWERIKNVYILGHSMGKVDIKYFERLTKETAFTAVWHVTCFDPNEKPRVTALLKNLRVQNYKIYSTIDDAIASFKLKPKKLKSN